MGLYSEAPSIQMPVDDALACIDVGVVPQFDRLVNVKVVFAIK